MALILCPECTKQISDHARACPSCGCPIPAPYLTSPSAQKHPVKTGPLGFRAETCMRFENPVTQETVEIRNPCAWTLLFGPLYWLKHGAWLPALLAGIAAIMSVGLLWLMLPILAIPVLRGSYIKRGWREA